MITKNAIIFILVAIIFILNWRYYREEFNFINSYERDWKTLHYKQFYTNLKSISNQPAEPTNTQPADIQPVETWEKNMDIVIRTTCGDRYQREYNKWYVPSYKMFWRFNNTKVKVVLDAEQQHLVDCIRDYTKNPPYANIVFRQPAKDPSIYKHSGRQRMIWDYFYPESFTSAQYVAFMDTDSMFVTTVTPESLFKDNTKPVVNARIGLDRDGSCWPATTLYFLGVKELMNCMSYFPMLYKTSHIIETRKYIEKRHNKPFDQVWKGVYGICTESCQFSVICNYVWHHHREEYDWHLNTIGGLSPNSGVGSLTPNKGVWNGEGYKPEQENAEYVKQLDASYKVPKHRVAIHTRHFIDTVSRKYQAIRNTFVEPTVSQLKYQLRHGLCLSFGYNHCPKQCTDINRNSLQTGMYSFEEYDWFYDKRCLSEQQDHYQLVEQFYNKYGIQPNCSLFDMLLL